MSEVREVNYITKITVSIASALVLSTSFARSANQLNDVFQNEMLGAQVNYLEHKIGPAMHVYKLSEGMESREYRVNGCQITAYASHGAIEGYSLSLRPNCNFNLGNFMGSGYGSTTGLTVGAFLRAWKGTMVLHAESECIDMCGNAADPSMDFIFEGPHAMNYLNVQLTVVLDEKQSIEAAEKLTDDLKRNEGSEYVTNTKFNCNNKYDALASKLFANVPVRSITVGSYLPMADFYKRGCGN